MSDPQDYLTIGSTKYHLGDIVTGIMTTSPTAYFFVSILQLPR